MNTIECVTFIIGEEEYGLDIKKVQSIERITPITRVPNAPAFVKGVINLRGNVTPIIDLRRKLGLGDTEFTESTRVLITLDEEIELGWIVDDTNDVLEIGSEHIEPASAAFDNDYFSEIAKLENNRLIILLKLDELMKPF